jgi:hypothetical protein
MLEAEDLQVADHQLLMLEAEDLQVADHPLGQLLK